MGAVDKLLEYVSSEGRVGDSWNRLWEMLPRGSSGPVVREPRVVFCRPRHVKGLFGPADSLA